MLCKKANFYSYQIAMVIWGIGGMLFSDLFFISKLAPKWLSIWGLIVISGAFFFTFWNKY